MQVCIFMYTIHNDVDRISLPGHVFNDNNKKLRCSIDNCYMVYNMLILQVVRCFEDNDIVHVSGKVDPKSDIDVINLELVFSDLDQVWYHQFLQLYFE